MGSISSRIRREARRSKIKLILVTVSKEMDIRSVLDKLIVSIGKQSRAVVLNEMVKDQIRFLGEAIIGQEFDPELQRILVKIKRFEANIFLFIEDAEALEPADWKKLTEIPFQPGSEDKLIQFLVVAPAKFKHKLIADACITPEALVVIRGKQAAEEKGHMFAVAPARAGAAVAQNPRAEHGGRIGNSKSDDLGLSGYSERKPSSGSAESDVRRDAESRTLTSLDAVSASSSSGSSDDAKGDIARQRAPSIAQIESVEDGVSEETAKLVVPALSLEARPTRKREKSASNMIFYVIAIVIILAGVGGLRMISEGKFLGLDDGIAPFIEQNVAKIAATFDPSADDDMVRESNTNGYLISNDVGPTSGELGTVSMPVQLDNYASTAQEESPQRLNLHVDRPAVSIESIQRDSSLIQKIEELHDHASEQMASKKLTLPIDDNALDTYREILRLDPDNQQARLGIDQIRTTYVKWAKFARDRGDLDIIAEYHERAQRIDPSDESFLAKLQPLANVTNQSGDRGPLDSGEVNTSGLIASPSLSSSPTALVDYAFFGDLKGVQRLLAAGFSPDYSLDVDGLRPLMYAAIVGHVEVAKALLESGANVDAKTNDSRTALMLAAKNGQIEIVELLLKHHADVSLESDDGETAISLSNGHEIINKMLLDDVVPIENQKTQEQ
ncbi:MAG: ankyrin repeat domain-containing protein [Gammaproteobacteria bacterium]|nr:ankyrin repeat domain-containing protein [Gammaproteobacteria bacterium]